MTALDTGRARPRRFWGDARFFLGILLIAVSVAGVWLVVAAARQTVPVLAASRTIVPGEVVAADDLHVVEVALGTAGDVYLVPGREGDGLIATRTIGEGELVPQAAVGAADSARVTSVVVRSDGEVPASVESGSRVEVWHAPPLEGDAHDAPRILVADATVASVSRDDGMIGGATAALELVIPRAEVAAVLAALADGSAVSVVPIAGAGG